MMELESLIFLLLLEAEVKYANCVSGEQGEDFEKARKDKSFLNINQIEDAVQRNKKKFGIQADTEFIEKRIMTLLNSGLLEMRAGKLCIGNRERVLHTLKSDKIIRFIFENAITAFSEDDLARMRSPK